MGVLKSTERSRVGGGVVVQPEWGQIAIRGAAVASAVARGGAGAGGRISVGYAADYSRRGGQEIAGDLLLPPGEQQAVGRSGRSQYAVQP